MCRELAFATSCTDTAADKDVHKNPVLEVVGWFTLCPVDGPLPEHAILHKQLTNLYSESGIMLAIHPTEFNAMQGTKGKLPVSVYESLPDTDLPMSDGAMQVDGSDVGGMRFRSIPYVVETDETEMIAINYVAKGAGSAAAITQTAQSTSKTAPRSTDEDGENKSAEKKETPVSQRVPTLTAEEEDQIAGMTTRLNSVRMLQERLQLLSRLVEGIPPSYISDQSIALLPSSPTPEHLSHLRNIQALLSRLSLLTPAGQIEAETLKEAGRAQSNDVALTSILSLLGQDIQGLSELGRKFLTVEQSKASRNKGKGGFGQGAYGSLDEFDSRPGGAAIDPSVYGL